MNKSVLCSHDSHKILNRNFNKKYYPPSDAVAPKILKKMFLENIFFHIYNSSAYEVQIHEN